MSRSAYLLAACFLALPLAAQPKLTKSYNPPSFVMGSQTSLLTFVITNTSGDPSQTGMSFTDNLPQGLEFVTTFGGSCSASNVSISSDRRRLIFSNGTLSGGSIFTSGEHSCYFRVQVRATACGTYPNNQGNFSGVSNLNVSPVNATLTVVGCVTAPPSLTKTFAPSLIPPAGSATLTFMITNSAGDAAQNGIRFTDLLPAGLVVDSVVANACGGTLNISPDHRAITFNGQLGPGQHSCPITIRVKASGPCGHMANNSGNFSGVTNLDVSHATADLEVMPCASGLTVRKTVDGAPPGYNAQFAFLVQCTTPTGLYQQTVTVAWPTPGFVGINDIPPGSSCTVTEGPLPATLPADTNWSGLPQYDPAGAITVTGNAEVTVTNTLGACNPTGKVTVLTTVQGLPANFSGAFAGTLHCWSGGTLTDHPITLTAPNALSSVVANIPLGSTCTFVETTQPPLTGSLQWNAPSYAPPFGTVTLDDNCCQEIAVINQARTCCTVNGVTACSVAPP